LAATSFLRGNLLTLDGPEDEVAIGQSVVQRSRTWFSRDSRFRRDDRGDPRRARATRISRGILEDVVWAHRGMRVAPKTINQKALRRRHPQRDDHGWHRTGRHGQVIPRRSDGRRRTARREVNRIVLTRPPSSR